MATAERGLDSWLSATLDLLLAVFGFVVVWYPTVSLANAVLGSPLSESTCNLLVGVLALGGSYPVVAGDWSLGRLGEYIFVFHVSAIGWGVVGMLPVLASGVSFAGGNRAPQAALVAVAHLTAYVLVYRAQLRILR